MSDVLMERHHDRLRREARIRYRRRLLVQLADTEDLIGRIRWAETRTLRILVDDEAGDAFDWRERDLLLVRRLAREELTRRENAR